MKKILVTGCSKGIGFEIVKIFSKESNIIILAISRDIKGLSKLKEECLRINPDFNLHILSIDLSIPDAINKILDVIQSDFNGSIDGVIHNAGYLVNKAFVDIRHEELDNSFKINLFAPFLLTQKLIPYFSENAHVLFISSMGGVQGSQKFKGLSAYSTSKAGLITLTECLAEEFKMTNLRFNCLALGAVQTEMLNRAFPGYKAPVSANEMGIYIVDFYTHGKNYFNGKVLPISLTTP